jgi:hypothetical protein
MTSGKLTSEEADGYYSALENHRRAFETAALEALATRMTAVEQVQQEIRNNQ